MKIYSLLSVSVMIATVGLLGCGANYESGTSQPTAEGQSGIEAEASTGDNSSNSDAAPAEEPAMDIVDTALAAGNFGTLAAALTAGELVDTLKSEGPFTVFAPTDDAFARLPEGTLNDLLKPENKEQLVAILSYHVVPGKIDSTAVASLQTAETVNGADIEIGVNAGAVNINNATVTTADIGCSNGIIHVIDTVILPPAADSTASHAGEPLVVEGVGSFNTLFAAIGAAGLNETLQSGKFTVFAPTDEAFAALPEGTVENLLKPENKEQLASILTYHVVAGEVPSSAVVELTSAETVNGADLTIEVADGTVRVNGATVLKTDIPCEVGLIHAIDKVLIP